MHVHTPTGPGFSLSKELSINNEAEKKKVAGAYVNQAMKREIRFVIIGLLFGSNSVVPSFIRITRHGHRDTGTIGKIAQLDGMLITVSS